MNARLAMLIPCATLLLAAAAPGDPAAAGRIRADVTFLSGDALQGRDTGSPGYAIAADYVARQFQSLGLKPAGSDGWYQTVPLRQATHSAPPTVSLVSPGRRTALRAAVDFGLRPSPFERVRDIDAPLVFVGHGISDARFGIDEYRGLDVRGKIVVALDGTPSGISSDVAAHLGSSKDDVAAAKGAVGLIEVGSDGRRRGPSVSRGHRPMVAWLDGAGRGGGSPLRVALTLSPQSAARLFDGAAKSLDRLRAEANQRPLAGFDLPGRLVIHSESAWQDLRSPNVVAVLPGSDPDLAAEHVVLMGHLDHLGIEPDAKRGEDAINNGAMDNAAGIATMIEAARHFMRDGHRPRRSVMFIAVTGEERGLLGADYFAARPTVPIGNIVGLVNLDMPLLYYDFSDVIAFGGEHSTVSTAVAEAGRSLGVVVTPDPMPEQTLFVRSDHYRFVLRGVPSVFLMTGHANGGKAAWDYFLTKVYHEPNDDLSQPIYWGAAARFAELNYRIARTLADRPERPLWYSRSYFGAAFAPNQPKAKR